MASSPNYLKAAFLHPGNLVGVLVGGVAAALTGEPTVLVAALGLEGLFLGMVSSAPAFQRAVRAKAAGRSMDLAQEVEGLLDELAASQREHYFVLKELKDRILANYEKLPGGRVLVASSEQRVDALLTAFLRLLGTLNGYRKYLNATDRKALEKELTTLREDADAEQNPRLREVKQKRVEILHKRVQRFQQAEESREVVSHQLAGIEDLLRLTHEQSIAIRDPESVGKQLDALTAEVAATEETVRELESFMEISEDFGRGSAPVRVR